MSTLNNDDTGEFFLGIPSRHAIRAEHLRSIEQGKTIYGNGRYAQSARTKQQDHHADQLDAFDRAEVTVVGAEITGSKLAIEDDAREQTGYNPYNSGVYPVGQLHRSRVTREPSAWQALKKRFQKEVK